MPNTDTTAPTTDIARNPATVPGQLRLALAAEPTAHSPLARGRGAPTGTWRIDGSDLVVEGWNSTPDLFAVRDPDRRLLGWVEALGDGWATYIKGHLHQGPPDHRRHRRRHLALHGRAPRRRPAPRRPEPAPDLTTPPAARLGNAAAPITRDLTTTPP
ncbi:hypothetical protein ACIOJE_39195 [Kitasatospora sp. NPDC087861]|uniref:hypothetical protein n=1 Tax=Kitasatospora sp. NPDC087861 TaxID=3364070 RepID=UPI003813C1E4